MIRRSRSGILEALRCEAAGATLTLYAQGERVIVSIVRKGVRGIEIPLTRQKVQLVRDWCDNWLHEGTRLGGRE